MEVTTVGLDLGKDVFQVHGITANGTVVFNRSIRRRQLLKFFETLPTLFWSGLRPAGQPTIGRVN